MSSLDSIGPIMSDTEPRVFMAFNQTLTPRHGHTVWQKDTVDFLAENFFSVETYYLIIYTLPAWPAEVRSTFHSYTLVVVF